MTAIRFEHAEQAIAALDAALGDAHPPSRSEP